MTNSKKSTEIAISHAFAEDELRSITVFKKRAQELREVEVLSGGKSGISVELNYDKNSGIKINANLPSEALLKELYMAFRFFYLNKEPSNFNRVANIAKRAAINESTNNFIKILKKEWAGALSGASTSGIVFNTASVSAWHLLDLWFNAHHFHSDEDKEKDLALLNKIMSEDFSKFLLAHSVYEASKVVFRLHILLESSAS